MPIGPEATRFERTVERLRAYRAAGADCVFAPGVKERELIEKLVKTVAAPLNILVTPGCPSIPELQKIGVARASVGSGVLRSTLGLVRRIRKELLETATNQTGRMFPGGRSGLFLYQESYDAGFANQPAAVNRDDGLRLKNAYITAGARCAPPENKPLPSEILNCRGYLEREIDILQPSAVLALGKIAWDVFLGILKHRGAIPPRVAYRFTHGAEVDFPEAGMRLFGVYHPSQQNTQTGLLTPAMYAKVLRRVRRFLGQAARLNTEILEITERAEKKQKTVTRRRGRR